MKKSFLLGYVILLMTACSSMQTTTNAKKVPPERGFNETQSSDHSAIIEIVRDLSLSGSICYYAIFADSKMVARIGTYEKLTLPVAPGEHYLKVTRDPQGGGLCGLGDDVTEEKVSVTNGEKRLYRLSMNIAGSPKLSILEQ